MKKTRDLYIARTALLSLIIVLVVFTAIFGLRVKIGWLGIDIDQKGFIEDEAVPLGLDLAGGVSVVFELVAPDGSDITAEGLADTIKILERRVSNPEASVYKISDTEIQLDIPGYDDPDYVIKEFGRSGSLNFRDADNNKLMVDTNANPLISNAYASTDPSTNTPVVVLEFTKEGQKQFKEATTKVVALKSESKNYLSIYVGDEIISSPSVDTVLDDDSAVITSDSFKENIDECINLASYIKAGIMEYELKCDEDHGSKSVVSASLGEEALNTSVTAAVIGLVLVMVFMIVMYRIPGVVASMSLAAYTAIVILCLIIGEVTLTLPGIAGIILSIGMAVDANVIIFERMKEELREGKSVKLSCEAGFKKALSSIIDSQVTTAIAAVVLIFAGTGMVKGFGITLLIGVVVSVLTAFFLSRGILKLFVNMGIVKPSLYCSGLKGGNN